jgi:peroxiredoxin
VKRAWVAVTAAALLVTACSDDASTADDAVVLTSSDAGGVQDNGIPVNRNSTGAAFPAVTITDATGAKVQTASLVGTPLVVNLWYSACPPCKKELPAFADVATQYTGKVRFVGVNTLDEDAGAQFARNLGVQYELLRDLDGELTTALHLTSYPVTVFVRADGTIAAQTGPLDEATLRSTIDTELLGG